MPNLKIRIGASVDQGMGDVAFASLVKASERASKAIQRNLGGGGSGGGGKERAFGQQEQLRAQAKLQADLTKIVTKGHVERSKIVQKGEVAAAAAAAAAKLAIVREETKAETQIRKQAATNNARIERDLARGSYRNQRIADAGALRVSGGAVRNMGGMVRQGVGIAADIGRGAGIDFSLGNAVKSRMALQTGAVDLSNAGYMPGKEGPNGQRQDPRALMADAQRVAQEYAIGADKALEGMQAFTGKTGDLSTARAILGDMARLSQATGSSMEDMVSAAGEVANALPEGVDKVGGINRVMKAFAGQGKEGAIEIKDQARQAAKLASRAGEFAGSPDQAMGQMGALVQMARAHGGAANAAQSFTALGSFMNQFGKGARRNAMAAKGVHVKDGDKGLLDAEEIIVQALNKTKGNDLAMGKMFADAQARKVTRGFEQVYNKAGGGKAGEAAVRAEFSKYKNSAMGEGEIADSLKAKLGTSESQATRLKNQIEKDLGDAVEKAAPNLMKLGAAAGTLVTAFGGMVQYAAANPFKTAAIAFTASMAKSFGSEMMRATIERATGNLSGRMAMGGAMNTGPQAGGAAGGAAAGRAATALGNLAAMAMIATTAVAAYAVGVQIIDKVFKDKKDQEDKLRNDEFDALASQGAGGRIRRANEAKRIGPETPEEAAEADKADAEEDRTREALAARVKGGEEWNEKGALGRAGARIGALYNDATGSGPGMSALNENRESASHMEELKATLATLTTTMGAMPKAGETIAVRVTNPGDIGTGGGAGPSIPPGVRTGP